MTTPILRPRAHVSLDPAVWTEQRRNLIPSPRPAALTGWTVMPTGSIDGEWIVSTSNGVATPYIFTAYNTHAITAGQTVYGSVDVRSDGAAIQYVHVSFRTSAAYVTPYQITPVTLGEVKTVAWSMVAPTNYAAGALRIAILPCSSIGGFLTPPTGQTYRIRRPLMALTPGPFFDGSSNPSGLLERTRWLGTVQASASVLETVPTMIPAPGSNVRLGSKDVPYVRASIVLPLLSEADLEKVDPRDFGRVPFTAGDATGTQRPFNLGLRTSRVSADGKTVTLDLASDEAVLMRYAPLADDRTPLTLASSIRSVVGHVLSTAIPGATLAAGSDAAVTPYWSTTNLLRSPSAETSTTEFQAVGMSVLRVTTPTPQAGTYAVRINRDSGAGNVSIYCCDPADLLSASPGQTYTFAIYVRSAVARTSFVTLRFFNTDGGSLRQVNGTSITTLTTGWSRISVTATAPAGTARVAPLVSFQSAAGPSEYHYVDAGIFVQGEFITEYFDGDTTDTANYLYDWSGTAHDSTTVRTLLTDKPAPEALVWRAGQTAWDFLLALTASVGMVLWCDELRVWRLIAPDDRATGSLINISATNTREATDTLSVDDTDTYATGIVAKFTWIDRDGISREAVDAAGTAQVVVVEEFNRPYPGPGIAAAMLARRGGTGRVQEVTAITVWETTPGMAAAISLPGAPDTSGTVTAVDFDLADGFMALETSGLIEVTGGDWAAVDPEIDWSDVTSTTDWTGM